MSIRASVVMCMVILCGFATLLLSGERMPLAVLGIAVLFAIISLPQLRIKGGIAVCLMTFLLGVTILGVPALKSRIIDFSLAQLSKPRDDAYGQIYVASIDMFKHNFWFGVGSKHFSHACQQLDHGESETFACACHPHNWYLQVLAENGIIGALLFATMVLALMWRVLRFRGAYYAYFSAALLFAKLLPFIPASSLYSTFSLTPLWLIVGIALLPPLKSGVAATPLPMP